MAAFDAGFREASLSGQDQLVDPTRSICFTSAAAAHDTQRNQADNDAEVDISQSREEVLEYENGSQESVARKQRA